MKEKRNIVWLKRDLRLMDHQPLLQATNEECDYLIIYIFEPCMIIYPDCSTRHLQFVHHSLKDLNEKLAELNRQVHVFHSDAYAVFDWITNQFDIQKVFSYQESGIELTWERDKEIYSLLKEKGILWKEFQRDGVIRGIKDRINWDQQWYAFVNEPILSIPFKKSDKFEVVDHPFPVSKELMEILEYYPDSLQPPGEKMAWKYLKSFCEDRGKNYNRHISKPLESRSSCGRISPYLAWGNLSIRQCVQFVINHPNYAHHKRAFDGLLTRLKWHCHFIQKFEVECSYETHCVNKGYESLEYTNDPKLIVAWKEGRTGFPLVDACMRCLQETGWINFRMRAMLVSVFCHHFDIDWREGVYHLARLFLDYEPGIHYPQFQMQAGTTGVNTIRMYNPVKQSKDHDPKGVFIKKWVKELEKVPEEFIHEPWNLTEIEKTMLGIEINYPHPMIDLEEAGKRARTKIWGHRKDPEVKKESSRIVRTHTRNNSKRSNAQK